MRDPLMEEALDFELQMLELSISRADLAGAVAFIMRIASITLPGMTPERARVLSRCSILIDELYGHGIPDGPDDGVEEGETPAHPRSH